MLDFCQFAIYSMRLLIVMSCAFRAVLPSNLFRLTEELICISNNLADFKSRNINPNLEWKLSVGMFKLICEKFGSPQIDLFASRLNFKVDKFVSYQHYPLAWKIDAFSLESIFGYAFLPINQFAKVVQKARMESSKLILICPKWTTQPWYTEVMQNAYDLFCVYRHDLPYYCIDRWCHLQSYMFYWSQLKMTLVE